MTTTGRKAKKRKPKAQTTTTAATGSTTKNPPTPTTTTTAKPNTLIQFNWQRHWKTKVEPYLQLPLVRASVEMGMWLFDPDWTWADGPHSIGRGDLNGQRVVKNKLSWYQPWGRCHWISFFAYAIGVLNYPDLDWQFLSGHCHTVAVGMLNGQPHVVMDILNFRMMTAAESIAHTRLVPPGVTDPEPERDSWEKAFSAFRETFVPILRKIGADPSLAASTISPLGDSGRCPWRSSAEDLEPDELASSSN